MKTITIRDETYRALQTLKGERDSFSDVIDRLMTRKIGSIRRFSGGLKDSTALDGLRTVTEDMRRSGRARL